MTPLMAQSFPWQENHAKVLPTGDLEYAPQPFEFLAGGSVRYIDFAGGDDTNDGSRASPWKHHPWDADARGEAAAAADEVHTYVFKGGVVYRGSLEHPEAALGTAEEPVRLTRDPSWGSGSAVICGSEIVTGWERKAHPKMPDGDLVWSAELDFLPRTVWMGQGAEPERLKLARWPNWEESDENDLMSEWPVWEQPRWWVDGTNVMEVNGRDRHLGIDEDLPRPLKDLVGGTVWTEWGIVMGSPYPAEIEGVDEDRGGIAFRGPWTYNMSNEIITGNRYHLEDLPQFLDEPGEFWVEKTGENSGRLYLRLPGDADPREATIEVGRHVRLLTGRRFGHLHVSGLSFRLTNVGWKYDDPQWAHDDLMAGAIHFPAIGDSLTVAHNSFEHVNLPVRIKVGSQSGEIGYVGVMDNEMHYTEHGAIHIQNQPNRGQRGTLRHVDVLRNRMFRIGMRNLSGAHGHAVNVTYPETSHMAGNFLHRIAGWGLSVTGGKGSGMSVIEVPLSRHLIHHNRVEDVLLKSNDWGGIETWQGGSHYVFDNVVINALGFKNWLYRPGDTDNIGSFGHAYYMDGSFKNYLFNNIGLGLNNALGTKGVNATAIQNIISFENWYFNNSFHRFAETTRQQAGDFGRFRYLGNVFSDTSKLLFRHAKPEDVAPDPNASHFTEGGDFDYHTIAYSQNVFHGVSGRMGTFEETGAVYDELPRFSEALRKVEAQASDVGVVAEQFPFVDPDDMNWLPVEGSVVRDMDVIVWVPWSTARTVGEWQFTLNRDDPAEVIDEHWYMTEQYGGRGSYKDTPRYALTGRQISAASFVEGPIANWTQSALQLDGRTQHLLIPNDELPQASGSSGEPEWEMTTTQLDFGKVTAPARVTPGQTFPLVVELDEPPGDQQVQIHLHWLKQAGFGGFVSLDPHPEKLGPRRFRFEIESEPKDDLDHYSAAVYLSPDGSFSKRTALSRARIDAGTGVVVENAPPRTVGVDDTNFMIEINFRTSDADGLLVQKFGAETGYTLGLREGIPQFMVVSDAGWRAAVATSRDQRLDDGRWHHLIAECNRASGELVLYVDGRRATPPPGKATPMEGSLVNPGDFLVGGGPGVEHLAMTVDFLKVSLSTLAESKTTIEELYAWQFNGPQYRDFAGKNRRRKNAAGALVGTGD